MKLLLQPVCDDSVLHLCRREVLLEHVLANILYNMLVLVKRVGGLFSYEVLYENIVT